MLKGKYGTGHKIDPSELKILISKKPDFIIISTGQNGSLKIDESVRQEVGNKKISLITLETPKAIKKFNQLIKQNKKINALIHTTC